MDVSDKERSHATQSYREWFVDYVRAFWGESKGERGWAARVFAAMIGLVWTIPFWDDSDDPPVE